MANNIEEARAAQNYMLADTAVAVGQVAEAPAALGAPVVLQARVDDPEVPASVGVAAAPNTPPVAQKAGETSPAPKVPVTSDKKPGSVAGSSAKLPGQRVTQSLRTFLKDAGRKGQVVQNPDVLVCFSGFQEMLEKTMHCDSLQQLTELMTEWKQGVGQLQQLTAALTKSGRNLKSHVSNLKRAAEREIEKKKKAEEVAVVNEVKKRTEVAAKQVKSASEETPALFKVPLEELQKATATAVAMISGELPADALKLQVPLLMKAVPAVEVWQKSPQIQVALGRFGGKYKKQTGYAEEGRSQMIVKSDEGKVETAAMFASIKSTMPKASQVGVDGLMGRISDAMWLFGYDPKMKTIACTPNGLPMLKVLANGEVKMVLFEIESLLSGLRTMWATDKIPYQRLVDDLPKLTLQDLGELKMAGVVMQSCVQNQWDVIYVPAGWIVAEESCKGVLLYGARCTFIARHPLLHSGYECLIGAFAASEKPIQNMQLALDCLAVVDQD